MKERLIIILFRMEYYQKQILRYVYILINASDDEKKRKNEKSVSNER